MNDIEQQIEIISSDLFITLDKFKRIELARDIAQNFCNKLDIPYIDFILEDFKNKTDGHYSARKEELKLNAHFF